MPRVLSASGASSGAGARLILLLGLAAAARGARVSALKRGMPVEVVERGRAEVCVFAGPAEGSSALRVLHLDGSEARVDAGQFIDVWDDGVGARDLAKMVGKRAEMDAAARALLDSLPPACVDLEFVWGVVDSRTAVRSLHVALYLTAVQDRLAGSAGSAGPSPGALGAESAVRLAKDAAKAARLGSLGADGVVAEAKAARVTATCRMAASLLLSADRIRFKRAPCQVADRGAEGYALSGGCYRPLQRSVVSSRVATAVANKLQALRASSSLTSSVLWEPLELQVLSELEVLALSSPPPAAADGGAAPPPARLGSETKQALRLLSCDAAPSAARDLLLSHGLWTSADAAEAKKDPRRIVPWPAERLREAKAAAAWIEEARGALAGGAKVRDVRAAPVAMGVAKPLAGREALFQRGGVVAYTIDSQASSTGKGRGSRRGTAFRDDAVGLDFERKELQVHIADVASFMPKDLAPFVRQRSQSQFLPDGSLPMLPAPLALAMAFSDALPTPAITVAFKMRDMDALLRGEASDVGATRIFRSIVPPAAALSFEDADACAADPSPRERSAHLRAILSGAAAIEENGRRARERGAAGNGGRRPRKQSKAAQAAFAQSPSAAAVDRLLSAYSAVAASRAKKAGILVPLQRGTQHGRVGTSPLRRWIHAVTQGQLLATVAAEGGGEGEAWAPEAADKAEIDREVEYSTWRDDSIRRLVQTASKRQGRATKSYVPPWKEE